jgi:hypothetical protein
MGLDNYTDFNIKLYILGPTFWHRETDFSVGDAIKT